MSSPKHLLERAVGLWQPLLAYLAGLAVAVGLLFFKLGTLLPGFSKPEVLSYHSSQTVDQLLNNPINLPYKVLVLGLSASGHISPFALRSISAFCGLVVIGLFYYTLSQWYAERTAILGTLLFASSAWFLHSARLADTTIMFGMLVGALAYGTWLRKTKHSYLALVGGALLASFLIYVPGLIWFVIAGGIWQRNAILRHYKHHAVSGFLVIILAAILLGPLAYGIFLHHALIRTIIGVQATGLPDALTVLHNIAAVPYQIFVRAPYDPARWLGTLPYLGVFAIVMFFLGSYAYYFMRGLDRTKMLLAAIVIGSVLVGFGVVNIIVLMPFVYIIVAAGLALMLQQWFTVFPRNPLARLIGATLMSLVVILAVFYHVNSYFIAWPNTPATKQAYRLHL